VARKAQAQVEELPPLILEEVKPVRGIFSWDGTKGRRVSRRGRRTGEGDLTHLASASSTASVSVDTKTSLMCGIFRCAMAMYLCRGCKSTCHTVAVQ